MSYIDIPYVILRADESELEDVLNTSDLTTCQQALQAISDAEDFVDESLQGIYTVPLTSPSTTIKKVTFYIALYFMYSYRYQSEVPENIVNDYKWALQYLKDVEGGNKKIVDQTELSTQETQLVINKESSDKYFDSDKIGQIL